MDLFQREPLAQDRRAALLTVVLLCVAAVATLPVATVKLPDWPALVALIIGGQCIIQLVAAWILLMQYRTTLFVPVAMYAVIESWSAVMMLVFFGSLPGIVNAQGFDAAHVRAWTYAVWGTGSTFLTLVYHWSLRRARTKSERSQKRFLAIVATTAAVCAIAWIVFGFRLHLPAILSTPGQPHRPLFYVAVAYFYSLVVVVIVSHLRTTKLATALDLAFAITIVGSNLASFSSFAGSGSYSIGFYTARFEVFVASSSMLVALLVQTGRIYESLRRENRQLSQQVFLDGLTGIANRRSFDERLKKSLVEIREKGTALIMMDIDNFKLYNDYFGHHRGDDCLKKVASAMALQLTRATDFVARYGGEEFAVVLLAADEAGAQAVAEKIRTAVEDLAIPQAPGAEHPVVTLSLGVFVAQEPTEDPSAVVARADLALYRSKKRGRNMTVVYDSALEQALG